MNKIISSKITALVFSVLVICFSIGFYIFAWTGPTASPPGDNTSAPINVGAEAQTKQGNLTIGTAIIKGDGSISTNLNSDKVDDLHAADLLAAGGGYRQCKLMAWSQNRACDAGWDTYISTNGTGCNVATWDVITVNIGSGVTYRNRLAADVYCQGTSAIGSRFECGDILSGGVWLPVVDTICFAAGSGARDSTVALCCQ